MITFESLATGCLARVRDKTYVLNVLNVERGGSSSQDVSVRVGKSSQGGGWNPGVRSTKTSPQMPLISVVESGTRRVTVVTSDKRR